MEFSSANPERSESDRILDRLALNLELAEEVMQGKLTYGGTIVEGLRRDLEEADEKSIDIVSLREHANLMIAQLPDAEIRNCVRRETIFAEKGDVHASQFWKAEAARLRQLRKNEI